MTPFTNEIEMFRFMESHFYSAALADILDEMGYPECVVSPRAMIRPLFPRRSAPEGFGPCSTLR